MLIELNLDERVISKIKEILESGEYENEKEVIVRAIDNLYERTKSTFDKEEWQNKPPTENQLLYLRTISYDGPTPSTCIEASNLIEDIEDIKIAVSEACTNIIQHAYTEPDSVGDMAISCQIEEGKLEISVTDTGVGFDASAPKSKKVDGKDAQQFGLGLGLTFIKSMMDDYSIESKHGQGTVVRMTKYVPQLVAVGND